MYHSLNVIHSSSFQFFQTVDMVLTAKVPLFAANAGLPQAIQDMVDASLGTVQTQTESTLNGIDPFIPVGNIMVSAIVLVSIISTWFFTYFQFGFVWYILLLVVVGHMHHRAHLRLKDRTYRQFREDNALAKMDDDEESAEWLNLFLTNFWAIFEPSLSQTIKDSVDTVLESSKPQFLDELRLSVFTLGSRAPRIDSVRSYPGCESDIQVLDLDLTFAPIDDHDLTENERKSSSFYKFNIELIARIGAGPASIPLPVVLRELTIFGKLRVQLKFMNGSPYIKSVDLGFVALPKVSFILRPLKGMDLKDIPGLSTFLEDTIDSILKSVIVNPNKISIDLESMGGSTAIDPPVGVFRVIIFDAKGLRNVDITGASDPCAVITIGGKEVGRTQVIENKLDPIWNEVHHIIIHKSELSMLANRSDEFKIEVFSINQIQHKSIGQTASLRLHRWIQLLNPVSFEELPDSIPEEMKKDADRPMTKSEHEWLVSQWGMPLDDASHIVKKLQRKNKKKSNGSVRFELSYFPIQENTEDIADFVSGLLTITVHQAKDLANSKTGAPECSISIHGRTIGKTPTRKYTNNPTWSFVCHTYVANIETAKIKFVVADKAVNLLDRAAKVRLQNTTPLGECTVSPQDYIGNDKEDWFSLFNTKSGKIRVTFKFKPVDMTHSTLDLSKIKRKEPCALIRVNMRKGENLANTEVLRKSDPYVKLFANGASIGATHVRTNTLDPEWNEIFYGVISNHVNTLSFETFDWNEMQMDKLLGSVEVPVCLLLPNNPHMKDKLSDDARFINLFDSLKRDGFELTPLTPTSVSVRIPLYQSNSVDNSKQQNQHVEDSSESENETEKVGGTIYKSFVKATNPTATFVKQMTSSIVPMGVQGKIKQRGHLVFDVEYFPVIADEAIRSSGPKVVSRNKQKALKSSPTKSNTTMSPEKPGKANSIVSSPPSTAKTLLDDSSEKSSPAVKQNDAATSVTNLLPTPEKVLTQEEVAAQQLQRIKEIIERHRSGVLRIRIFEAVLAKEGKYYVDIILDQTSLVRTRVTETTNNPKWLESHEKFVTDMMCESFILCVFEQIGSSKHPADPVAAYWQGDYISELLGKTIYDLPLIAVPSDAKELNIKKAPPKQVGTLAIELQYSPVDIEFDLSAKFNSGILQIDVLEAKGLKSVDTNGLSDPYCIIRLNGNRIFKSKVQKATLNPVFNENLSTPIKSRLRSTLEIELMDWNSLSTHKTLGRTLIRLSDIPASEVITKEFQFEGFPGALLLRMYFDPQIIAHDSSQKTDAESMFEDNTQTAVAKFFKGLNTNIANKTTFIGRPLQGKKQQNLANSSQNNVSYLLETANRPSSLTRKSNEALEDVNVMENRRKLTEKLPRLSTKTRETTSASGSVELASVVNQPQITESSDVSKSVPSIVLNASNDAPVAAGSKEFVGFTKLHIIEAKGLKAVDSNGSSDPFVKVVQIVDGKPKTLHKSSVVKKSLSPVWNEEFVLESPPSQVQFFLKDHNNFFSNINLGHVGVDLTGFFATAGSNSFDSWFPLEDGIGEIHISGEVCSGPTHKRDKSQGRTSFMSDKKKSTDSLK